jgi:hypothetical protein
MGPSAGSFPSVLEEIAKSDVKRRVVDIFANTVDMAAGRPYRYANRPLGRRCVAPSFSKIDKNMPGTPDI